MSKPEINIPTEFAANGTKVDFPNDKILSGFDPINPDILPGDCLNKFIDDTYKGLNGVLELYDTKVNKAGDTMTGELYIRKNSPAMHLRNSSFTKGTNPSSTLYWEYKIEDSNDNPAEWYTNRVSNFSTNVYTDGTVESRMTVYKNDPNSEASASMRTQITSEGVASCDFPNTTCCDGQWVRKESSIFSKKSWAVGTNKQTYSLSSYLPNDGYPYEVFVTGDGSTGSTSASDISCRIGSSYINENSSMLYRCQTRSGSSVSGGGCTVLPIGTDRNLKVQMVIGTAATGNTYLNVLAYRRIGTNA